MTTNQEDPLSKPLKYIIGIPLVLLLGLILFWDPNWFKSNIDQQLQTVKQVSIEFEQLHHSLLSPGEIVIENINLSGELVSGTISRLSIKTQINPLFSKQVIVDEILLVEPNLIIDSQKLQQLSEVEPIEPTPDASKQPELMPIEYLLLKNLIVENASITDISAEKMVDISGLNIKINNVQLIENALMIALEEMPSASVSISTTTTQVAGQDLGKVNLELQGNGAQILLNRLQAQTAESKLSINGQIDSPLQTPIVNLNVNKSHIKIDEFATFFQDLPIKPSGTVNLSGVLEQLALTGNKQDLLKALNGSLDIGFDQGKIEGIDINQMISAIKESRETDMKDIGGFLLTGPIGILATQFIDLGTGSLAMSGETQIPQLHFSSKIDKGVLNLKDTAFATDEYRMALAGGLDLAKNQFKDFTFSILNDDGCADIQQTLNGDIDNPSSAVANALLETIISPLKGLLKNVSNQVTKCTPVYNGSVKHPKKSNN